MASDSVIQALLTAVEAAPADPDLRLHLAGLLAESDPAGALEHLRVALRARPDDVGVLRRARDLAISVGDHDLAERYERLVSALGDDVSVIADPSVLDHRAAVDTDAEPPDEFDEFLRGVVAEDRRRRVRLADVAGLAEVKRQLELSFLGPLRSPELRAAFGRGLRGGLLLYGPPGCGKTYLARALAGELDAAFVPVGLDDVLDMWLGNSEKRLHELFESARRLAPAVMFFDELDAIGMRRTELRRSAARNVISQLLTELDGVAGRNDDVFVLGATNQPWDVDPALRRTGRFDRTLLVLPPDRDARQAIIETQLRDRPTDRIDTARLAAATEHFSGADLRLLCDAAADLAIEASVAAGGVVPISENHLRFARKQTRPSTRAWFDVAESAARFANRDGAYDDLLAHLDR